MSPSDRPRNPPRKLTSDRAHFPPLSWSPCDVELPQVTLANSSGSLLPLTKEKRTQTGLNPEARARVGWKVRFEPFPSCAERGFYGIRLFPLKWPPTASHGNSGSLSAHARLRASERLRSSTLG